MKKEIEIHKALGNHDWLPHTEALSGPIAYGRFRMCSICKRVEWWGFGEWYLEGNVGQVKNVKEYYDQKKK